MIDEKKAQLEMSNLLRAQRTFESEESGGEQALRAAITQAREQLAAWEAAGEYFPASVRILRDQALFLEALIENRKQRRA